MIKSRNQDISAYSAIESEWLLTDKMSEANLLAIDYSLKLSFEDWLSTCLHVSRVSESCLAVSFRFHTAGHRTLTCTSFSTRTYLLICTDSSTGEVKLFRHISGSDCLTFDTPVWLASVQRMEKIPFQTLESTKGQTARTSHKNKPSFRSERFTNVVACALNGLLSIIDLGLKLW